MVQVMFSSTQRFIIFTTQQIKAPLVSVDYIQIGPSICSTCECVMKTESEKMERRDFMVNHARTHARTQLISHGLVLREDSEVA